MFRLWRNVEAISRLKAAFARLLSDLSLMMGQGKVARAVIVTSIALLIVVPIVLVTTGFDLESIATYGYAGVFVATFLSSTTIIFPAPGIVVVIAAAALLNPAWVAVVAAVGSTLGEFTGYLAGYSGGIVLKRRYWRRYQQAERWMARYGVVTIFLFAFFPFLIFDLVGIFAGTIRYPFWKFMLACFAGRLPRSFIEAYMGWWILPPLSG